MREQKERKPTSGGLVSFQTEAKRSPSFEVIIHRLAQKAKANGLDVRRVDRAVALVLHPHCQEVCWRWSKADPETLHLRSQSEPGKWYHVNGRCECEDYRWHGPWCKHRIARLLILRAEEMLLELVDAGPASAFTQMVAGGESETLAAEAVDAAVMPFAEWRRHHGREVL